MTETFVTADLHLDNLNIIGYEAGRQRWADPQEMNEGLVDGWNSVVGVRDDVYVVGDFAMGRIAESLPITKRLNGRKMLITGNHDRTFPGMYKPRQAARRVAEWTWKYLNAGFSDVDDEIILDGFLVSHFPYSGDGRKHFLDRYPQFRPKFDGRHLLCGHVHSAWEVKPYRGILQMNVGVDVHDYKPVNLDFFKSLIA